MSENRFHVIKDTREKDGHGWWWEESSYCSGTTKAKLDVGDYSLEGFEDKLCIERKESAAEFANNCTEKRFWTLMDKMATYKHSFLILEFSWLDIERFPEGSTVPKHLHSKIRVKGRYMMSVLSTMMVDKGIQVLACDNKKRAEEMAFRIMRKVHELY